MNLASAPQPTLLLVDDDAIIAESLEYVLSDDFDVRIAGDRPAAERLLSDYAAPPVLALVDLGLPPDTHKPDEGFAVIEYIRENFPTTQVMVLSGQDDTKYVDSARKLGAVDFIAKPCDVAQLKVRLRRLLPSAESALNDSRPMQGIVGDSAAIELLRMQIRQLADSPYPVLIEGESGSGKELAAQYLHSASQRHERPFMTLNCAAFNGELLESQLFGHARGAFTGATDARSGFFEESADGTLFLDEVADLPMDLQAKLLRVLENGEYYRLGETRPRQSSARVLAASNKNLLQAIEEGAFREDLYHRLSVLTLRVPSLDEREDDKLLLLEHFQQQLDSRLKGFTLDDEARELWRSYEFSGNVRELRNIVIRLSAKYPGQMVKRSALEQELDTRRPLRGAGSEDSLLADKLAQPGFQLNEELRRLEQRYIELALEKSNHNMSKAAEMLGVNRSTLYGRLERGDNKR